MHQGTYQMPEIPLASGLHACAGDTAPLLTTFYILRGHCYVLCILAFSGSIPVTVGHHFQSSQHHSVKRPAGQCPFQRRRQGLKSTSLGEFWQEGKIRSVATCKCWSSLHPNSTQIFSRGTTSSPPFSCHEFPGDSGQPVPNREGKQPVDEADAHTRRQSKEHVREAGARPTALSLRATPTRDFAGFRQLTQLPLCTTPSEAASVLWAEQNHCWLIISYGQQTLLSFFQLAPGNALSPILPWHTRTFV